MLNLRKPTNTLLVVNTDYPYLSLLLRRDAGSTSTPVCQLGSEIDPSVLVEPGAVIQRFLNARDCYVMQSRPEGRYFSYIGLSHMLTVLVHEGYSLSGEKLVSLFTYVKRLLNDNDAVSQAELLEALTRSGIPEQGACLASWRYLKSTPEADAAYRTYASMGELDSIFSFPAQPEYEAYRCIILVPATTSLRPGVRMKRITAPIKKQYTVVCPEGVTASKEVVYDGDSLTLTYSCPGYDPRQETMVVGQTVVYARPEGSALKVKTADECGIAFMKRVPVKVVSSKGGPVMGYTIEVNGRPCDTRQGYIELSEPDLRAGKPVEVIASSANFQTLRLMLNPSDIPAGELTLTLNPLEQGVRLALDFGEGRVIDVDTQIEKNTPEYNRLRSGRFHGYRANLQATTGPSGEEVYHVDLRRNQMHDEPRHPVTPPPPLERHTEEKPERQTPVFENVTTPHSDPVLGTRSWVQEQEREAVNEETSKKGVPYLRWMIWGAAIVLAIVIVAFLIPDGETNTVAEAASATEQTRTATGQQNASTQSSNADFAYFDANTSWDKSKVTTDSGKQLIQAMENGDIDAIANHPYFKGHESKNLTANSVVSLLWQAKGSPNERGNVKKLKASAAKPSISLDDLYDQLMRVRPADKEANQDPRP